MNQKGKSNLVVTAVYKDGTMLVDSRAVPARTHLQEIDGAPAFREVSIRMVVASRWAEALFEALSRGEVALEISGIPSPLED